MNKLDILRTLRYNLESKQKELSMIENKNKLEKSLSYLIENNLDQAKLIIASQDVIEKLQKIAERLAELNAEEIMPLSDAMKAAFGQEIAQQFEHVASESIQTALEAVRAAKDAIDNAVLQVEGKIAPEEDSDMAKFTPDVPNDVSSDESTQDPSNDQTLLSMDDTEESNQDDVSEINPIGRELRDSKINNKSYIKENNTKELTDWYIRENQKNIPESEWKTFFESLVVSLKEDKLGTIEKIKKERNLKENNKSLRTVRAIASIIESNVSSGSPTKASDTVRKFVGDNLNEDSSQNVLRLFQEEYGCSPSIYAAKLKRNKLKEVDINNTTGSQANSNSDDDFSKEQVLKDKAVASISSQVASNPAVLNQPISNVTSSLSPEEQSAVNNDISSDDNINSTTTVKNYLQTKSNTSKTLNC